MINDKDIQNIADFLTEDPDIFQETKKRKGKVDEVECEDEFDIEGPGHENQKEPRKPGQQTHKTSMQDIGKDHPGALKESTNDKAPFQLYLKPDGRLIVWEADDTKPSAFGTPTDAKMDKPDPSWKLLRGFSSKESLLDYARNSPKIREYMKKVRARRGR